MSELDRTRLASVTGGMNLDGLPRSPNVEDRRGWSVERSMNAPVTSVPLPRWNHQPGDLADQAGYGAIEALARRSRRR